MKFEGIKSSCNIFLLFLFMLLSFLILGSCGGGGENSNNSTVLEDETRNDNEDRNNSDGVVKITIHPEGGKYSSDEGISVDVPEGAVNSETTLHIKILNGEIVEPVLKSSGLTDKELIVSFDIDTRGVILDGPITLTIPFNREKLVGLPFLYQYNPTTQSYIPAYTELTIDAIEATINIVIDHSGKYSVAGIKNILKEEEIANNLGTTCKDGLYDVKESATESISTKGDGRDICVVSEINGQIVFLECAGHPIESWSFAEVSKGCVPILTLEAPESVSCDGNAEISAIISLSGEPLEEQFISFIVDGDAYIDPSSGDTDSDGKFRSTLTSGINQEELSITATAEAEYIISYVESNGQPQQSKTKSKVIEESVTLYVAPTIQIYAEDDSLSIGEQTAITALLQCGNIPEKHAEIEFDVTLGSGIINPAVATTSSSGQAVISFTAVEDGVTTITATYQTEIVNGKGATISEDAELFVETLNWTGTVEFSDTVIFVRDNFGLDIRILGEFQFGINDDSDCKNVLSSENCPFENCEDVSICGKGRADVEVTAINANDIWFEEVKFQPPFYDFWVFGRKNIEQGTVSLILYPEESAIDFFIGRLSPCKICFPAGDRVDCSADVLCGIMDGILWYFFSNHSYWNNSNGDSEPASFEQSSIVLPLTNSAQDIDIISSEELSFTREINIYSVSN